MEASSKESMRRYEFDRLPRESVKAFTAFRAYLEMGPERSLATVAAKLGKSKVLMERWSRRHDWVGRVAAHAGHLAIVEREATEALTRARAAGWVKRQEEHREEEWTLRGELITAGRRVLGKFVDGTRGATLGDVARALELASKLGRLSSGLSTETVEHTGVVDVNLRVQVEAAVKKVYGEVVEAEVVESQRSEIGGQRSVTQGTTGLRTTDNRTGGAANNVKEVGHAGS
jgi:hypothetical protein